MKQEQKRLLISVGILIILCFAVYFNSLNNAFVSDDIEAILENPSISQPSRYWLEPTSLLNSLSYLISGFNPFTHHLINIILHAINTILVFFFLRLFFKTEASLLAACLFATHPIHTEAVTWISGKPYLILTLFILTIYLLYHKATNSINFSNRKFNLTYYIFSLTAFSYFIISHFGFFSITPLLLILSDLTFNRWRKNWKLWIPFITILILRLILAKGMIFERISFVADTTGQGIIWTNPLIKMTIVLFSHLGLLLWPLKLTFYHDSIQFFPTILKFGIIPLLFFLISLPFIFNKAKEIFFGICLFVLFFVPVYSPVAVASLISERYLYFPSISLCIFAGFLYEGHVNKSDRLRRIILSLFISIIVLYSIRTIIRNEDWKTPEKFWQATATISYNSPSANNEIGLIYNRRGNIKKAIVYFKKAIELDPYHSKAYNDLGGLYYDMDKKQEAKALFEKAIKINPRLAVAYNNLGNIYYDMDKKQEAAAYYQKAIEINPYLTEVYNNLGNIYNDINKKEKAVAVYKKALAVNPDFAKACYNLGSVYYELGKYKEAIISYRKAISINPDFAMAHNNLAIAYYYSRQYALAIKHCDRAIRLGYKVRSDFLELLEPYRR